MNLGLWLLKTSIVCLVFGFGWTRVGRKRTMEVQIVIQTFLNVERNGFGIDNVDKKESPQRRNICV